MFCVLIINMSHIFGLAFFKPRLHADKVVSMMAIIFKINLPLELEVSFCRWVKGRWLCMQKNLLVKVRTRIESHLFDELWITPKPIYQWRWCMIILKTAISKAYKFKSWPKVLIMETYSQPLRQAVKGSENKICMICQYPRPYCL